MSRSATRSGRLAKGECPSGHSTVSRAPAGHDPLQVGMHALVLGAHDVGRRRRAPRAAQPAPRRASRCAGVRGVRTPTSNVSSSTSWYRQRARPVARQRRRAVVAGHHRVPEVRTTGVRDRSHSGIVRRRVRTRLTVVEREGAQVDEVAYRGMDAGLGDHRAAVRVAEQHDVAVDRVERVAHRGDVGLESLTGEIDGAHVDTRVAHEGHDAFEAPGSVPRAVDEHDGRGRVSARAGHALLPSASNARRRARRPVAAGGRAAPPRSRAAASSCAGERRSKRWRRTLSTCRGAAASSAAKPSSVSTASDPRRSSAHASPAHPPELLEPGHRVREATPRRLGGVGELAHAPGPAGRLREHHQDLVVAEREAGVALEVALDLLPEQAGAHDPAQPDPAFVGVEPPHPVPHGRGLYPSPE